MRRPGITLLEVLSAIFITGIGLLSLLTLFPLGALKMAEALQDDRAAQAGVNGQAIANAAGMRNDPQIQAAMMGQTILNPVNGMPISPSPDGPGWPVLVDPIGQYSYPVGTAWQNFVAGDQTIARIPRVVGAWLAPFPKTTIGTQMFPGDVSPTQAILRWCSVQDDLYFVNDGAYQGLACAPPAWYPGGGLGVQRNTRYTYAWLLRMPRSGAPNVIDVSVLVFSGRSLDLVGFGTQETEYQNAVFSPQTNTVALPPAVGATEPANVRKGQWILDASNATVQVPGSNPPQFVLTSSHGYFYRIVSVSDPILNATNNTYYVNVEVQTPLRGWPDPNITPANTGTVVIFDNLVEVFEEGTY